jgi:hypothetical protein
MWQSPRQPVNDPLMPWSEALDQPGAAQLRHARALLASRPFLSRVPDASIVVASAIPTAVPGEGRFRLVATRDVDGTYAMVYAPAGRPFAVRMDVIAGARVSAWWFDPRTGAATAIGGFANTGTRTFTPPNPGEYQDWVLVLDDAARGYGPPGGKTSAGAKNGGRRR